MGMHPEGVVVKADPRIGRKPSALSVIVPCFNELAALPPDRFDYVWCSAAILPMVRPAIFYRSMLTRKPGFSASKSKVEQCRRVLMRGAI